jgi:uncharacterized membrane protein
MAVLEESVEVAAPVSAAYEAWTRFEEYPTFMQGVVAVEMVDDDLLRWRTQVEGVERTWEAQITELRPDERVAWRGTGEELNAGLVTFDRLDGGHTRVTVAMTFDVTDYVGKVADVGGALRARMRADLESFKALLEP